MLHSQPKSTVGTPAYIAPEVLSKKEYDGKVILGSFILFFTYSLHKYSVLQLILKNYRLQMFGPVVSPYM